MGKAATDHFLFSFKQGSLVSLLPAHGGYGPPSFMLLPSSLRTAAVASISLVIPQHLI